MSLENVEKSVPDFWESRGALDSGAEAGVNEMEGKGDSKHAITFFLISPLLWVLLQVSGGRIYHNYFL